MNANRINKILASILAVSLVFVLAVSSVSAYYPYSNYYGPSDSGYYKETKTIDKEDSKVIRTDDFYEAKSSKTSEKTTVERGNQESYINKEYSYQTPKSRYYDYDNYRDYYYNNPTNNAYYANHFADYQYPYYSYNQPNYYSYSTWNQPKVTYLSGDNPRNVGYEHYSDPYYYQPTYDWHTSYYVYPY